MEFIVDTITGDFYFMEMNTRLQVRFKISVHMLENVPSQNTSRGAEFSIACLGDLYHIASTMTSFNCRVQCLALLNSIVESFILSYLVWTYLL